MKKCFSSRTLFPSVPNRLAETVAIVVFRKQALRDDTSGGWGASDSGK